jgi:hypothetical protein
MKDYLPLPLESITHGLGTQRNGMRSLETDTHTFVVRFWLEAREIAGKKRIWRGVIEHLASGNQRYLKEPSEIISFIEQYGEGKETQQSPVWGSREWLKAFWSRIYRKS